MTLAEEFSVAAELADKSFSTEETSNQALAGFADFELQRFFKSHDVSCIDGEFAVFAIREYVNF